MHALSDLFGDRIISIDICPAGSPDPNYCDFFLELAWKAKFTAINLEGKIILKRTFLGKFKIFLQSIFRR
jgi:hypothetical protein